MTVNPLVTARVDAPGAPSAMAEQGSPVAAGGESLTAVVGNSWATTGGGSLVSARGDSLVAAGGESLPAVGSEDAASTWSGVWIAEDIELVAQGVQNRSWVDGTLGVVGAGLDGLALVSDPVGALLQYGISWLIEHVRPLSEALDWLAGDPGQIAAHAQTWRNVAGSLRAESDDLTRAVRTEVAEWHGAAADAYQRWAAERDRSVQALARASDTMALLTDGAGTLIGTVRMMVRDAVATVVSRLIVYAGELVATAGLATPLVAEQVSTLCASWAAKIAQWLRALIASIRNLLREAARLGELITLIAAKLRHPRGRVARPSGTPSPDHTPRGARTHAHPTRVVNRPHRRENESADLLARHGYDVEQNPEPKPNGKKPDYKIEGQYFDCYAPATTRLDQIRKGIQRKIDDGQATRFVLNLDDCPRSVEEIRDLIHRQPIAGLEQILIVQSGDVIPFYPFD